MEIEFGGLVSKKEYQRAFFTHFDSIRYQIFKWLGGFLALLMLSGIFFIIARGINLDTWAFFYFIPILVLTIPWWQPLLAAASYNNQNNVFRRPIQGVLDENNFNVTTYISTVSINWNGYIGYRHKNDMILLYQTKNCFNILPKTLFHSDEDWNAFLEFLKSRFPKGSKSIW
jgi:hypothetical protein